MDALTAKVAASTARYSMLMPGVCLGVAVSGGADSICLLHVLHTSNQQLTVIHVNHHLRGKESDADEQFVKALAVELSVPFLAFHLHLPAEGNLEQSARDGRREIFHQLIASGTVGRVALAHTRSDQAETVLFRLLRGAYITGLAGMRPVTHDGLVRPMLDVTRVEIEDWLKERNLPWREDASNRDLTFARNRIRHELLPQLEREWNPGLGEILANHAKLAQDDEDYWSRVICKTNPDDQGVVDLNTLPESPALRRRVLRETIRSTKGDLKGVDYRHIEQILELANNHQGHGRLQIPGVDIMRSFHWLRFAKPRKEPVDRNWSVETAVPGVCRLPVNQTEIVLEVRDTLGTEDLDWLRVTAVGEPFRIRNWRPGDRYQRVGSGHEEKLKTLFHDGRVPLWERRDWPILCLGEQILWSRRFGPAAEFAATSGPVLSISERKRIAAQPESVRIT